MFTPEEFETLDPVEVDAVLAAVEREKTSEREEPPGIVTVPLENVRPELVSWLWPGWIPRGRLTLVAGDPGVGKSWLTHAITASVTTGRGLCGEQDPQTVVLVALEDDPADTLRPRLEALGADLKRVHVYRTVRDVDPAGKLVERGLTFPEDAPLLADLIKRTGAALVIIDPLVAAQNAAIDSHRQAAMRSILQPLHAVAQETGAAVVFTVHLRKSASDNVLYRACGSIDLVAAVRTAIAVGRDPNNPARRGAAVFKSNLAEFPEPVAFRLDNGRMLIEFGTAPNLTADKLLGPPAGSEERTAQDEAQDFLRELLADGPVEARAVIKEAKAAGIAERTLNRAKAALGVTVKRQGVEGRRGGGAWFWSLPGGLSLPSGANLPNKNLGNLNREALSPTAPRDCGHGIKIANGNLNQDGSNLTAARGCGDGIKIANEGVRDLVEDGDLDGGLKGDDLP